MSDMERLHRIKYMIQSRGCVPIEDFMTSLEISRATFKRDLDYLRDRMNAPIVYDRSMGGYRFDKPNAGDKIELPGLWFSEKEATALVLMQHLLANLDTSGLLSPHIAPLMDIVDGILGQSEVSAKELRKRIKVFGMSARKNVLENFEEVGVSLLKRQRLHLSYYSKGKDELTERAVSPQRLIFYRDNWYLDAYCHFRKGLRSFAMDGIRTAHVLEDKATEVPEKELHENSIGITGIWMPTVIYARAYAALPWTAFAKRMSWKIKPLRSPRKNCMRTLPRVMASSLAKPRSVPSYALLLRKPAGCLLRPGMVSK